ncbi:MAG: hypothetical protein D6740_12645 [Alphaproteobacteria bacterium]|nr:MAG: hypothetical protein D6740_12645 [Alphaproteobacteria bacterium]
MMDVGPHNLENRPAGEPQAAGTHAASADGPTAAGADPASRSAPAGGQRRHAPATRLLFLLVILTILLALGFVLPLFEERTALRDELVRLDDEIARAEALIAAAPELQAQLAGTEQELTRSGLLLAGDSAARAAAQLQTRIQTLADAAEVELRQLQVHPTPAREPGLPDILEPVEIEMELVADIQGLRQMLAGLETGRPLVFLRRLHIRARLERADPRTGNYSVMPELIVSMTVRGYHLLPAAASDTARQREEGVS